MLSLCLPPSPSVRPEYRGLFADSQLDAASKAGRLELLKSINGQLREWKELLRRFLKSSDDQVGGWVGGKGGKMAPSPRLPALLPLLLAARQPHGCSPWQPVWGRSHLEESWCESS